MRVRFATCIVILICCFGPSARTQQTPDVAYIETVRVKPGENEKFETTLKRHWGWHEKQRETWSYLVWAVDTGKNDGAYKIVSFDHTWKEVDESNALVAGTPPPEEDPEPYQQTVQESYYRYRPELSIGSPAKPLPVACVNQIVLKPEAVQDFEMALRRIKRLLPSTDGAPVLSAQWYELVTGGDQPEFLLIEEHRDWASFHGDGELEALKKGNHGNEIPEEVVKSFWNSVGSIYSETWHYRSDLSRLIAGK